MDLPASDPHDLNLLMKSLDRQNILKAYNQILTLPILVDFNFQYTFLYT